MGSRWGPGRPGWHIECSALALRELGETIDVHGGGRDLVFPHHECETAQSESVTGRPFVRHWLHVGLVGLNGTKMSKSLGNLVFVGDLLKDWEPTWSGWLCSTTTTDPTGSGRRGHAAGGTPAGVWRHPRLGDPAAREGCRARPRTVRAPRR